MKFKLLFSFLIILIFISCRKEVVDDNGHHFGIKEYHFTLNGAAFKNCSQQPYSNKELIFQVNFSGEYFLAKTVYDTAYSDSSGNFNFDIPYSIDFRIGEPMPTTAFVCIIHAIEDSIKTEFTYLTQDFNSDTISYILKDTVSLIIKLNSTGNHSTSDTLYYGINKSDYHWKTGPFSIGNMDTLIVSEKNYSLGYNALSEYGIDTLYYGFGKIEFLNEINNPNGNLWHAQTSHAICTTEKIIELGL